MGEEVKTKSWESSGLSGSCNADEWFAGSESEVDDEAAREMSEGMDDKFGDRGCDVGCGLSSVFDRSCESCGAEMADRS